MHCTHEPVEQQKERWDATATSISNLWMIRSQQEQINAVCRASNPTGHGLRCFPPAISDNIIFPRKVGRFPFRKVVRGHLITSSRDAQAGGCCFPASFPLFSIFGSQLKEAQPANNSATASANEVLTYYGKDKSWAAPAPAFVGLGRSTTFPFQVH